MQALQAMQMENSKKNNFIKAGFLLFCSGGNNKIIR